MLCYAYAMLGAWAAKLAASAGVACPLQAFKHAYVVTERVPGLRGLPSIRDYNAAVYMKVSGDVFHIGGYERNPHLLGELDDGFAFGLYELDYDAFGANLDGHIRRVPCLEEVGIA